MVNPKINFKVLTELIKKQNQRKTEFAREHGFPIQQLINWTNGYSSPSIENHIKLLRIFDVHCFTLYVPRGIDPKTCKDIEMAKTREAHQFVDIKSPSLTNQQAIYFLFLIKYQEGKNKRDGIEPADPFAKR